MQLVCGNINESGAVNSCFAWGVKEGGEGVRYVRIFTVLKLAVSLKEVEDGRRAVEILPYLGYMNMNEEPSFKSLLEREFIAKHTIFAILVMLGFFLSLSYDKHLYTQRITTHYRNYDDRVYFNKSCKEIIPLCSKPRHILSEMELENLVKCEEGNTITNGGQLLVRGPQNISDRSRKLPLKSRKIKIFFSDF